MTRPSIVYALFALGPLAGCLNPAVFEEPGGSDGRADGGDVAQDPAALADGGDVPAAPVCTPTVHLGIGGIDLAAGRVDAPAAADRRRVKAHASLAGELARVTAGTTPASLAAAAPTFGAVPDRWYVEPQASAMVLYAAYQIGFEACLQLTASPPEYAGAPTASSAPGVCSALITRFWSAEPSSAELDACTQLAAVDSAAEPDPRRRWAYVCAALLSSSGFLTY